jgi:hypothetical protein
MKSEPIGEHDEAVLYHDAYALVRTQLIGLSEASEYPTNSRFDRLLDELDATHQGDPPPASAPRGNSLDEMLTELRAATEQMINHGGDATYLRVTYHLAKAIRRGR